MISVTCSKFSTEHLPLKESQEVSSTAAAAAAASADLVPLTVDHFGLAFAFQGAFLAVAVATFLMERARRCLQLPMEP